MRLANSGRFCGINFCDFNNNCQYFLRFEAISESKIVFFAVDLQMKGFCGTNFCGWQNPKDCAELIFAIFVKIAKMNSAKINSAWINSAKK